MGVTHDQYSQLTMACDELLRDPELRPGVIAVPWLHVQSEHPSTLARYAPVLTGLSPFARAKRALLDRGRVAWVFARSLVSRSAFDEHPALPEKVDVVLVSHVMPGHTPPGNQDFYYGDLPQALASRGLSSLVVLLNDVPRARRLRVKLNRGGPTARLAMPPTASARAELRAWRRAQALAAALRRKGAVEPDAFRRVVVLEAARQASSARTTASLRLHDQLKSLCAKLRPKALLVLWEGHASEPLAFDAARAVDPAVRCIGYQHTVLFPRSHAVKRRLGGAYDPDCIVTVGDVNRDVLQGAEGLRGVPVVTYGSHRRSGSAAMRAPDSGRRCLVIPEGLDAECLILFDFAVAAALRMADMQFVLRMHPVLPFERFVRRYPRFGALPPNVRVSDEADIGADLAKCDWALYRGSSAAVYAVLAGVRPIYVARPGELRIDPLFALQGWRREANTVDAFAQLVAADRWTAAGERQREWESARAFCDKYAAAPSPDVLHGLLAN